ncbi:hypothetical protein ACODT5_02650 [Streptomyces sp. 5.8]|uniref:hypothetical protein n=1 Tax=Streptomyces sp. 5.8 TaxID=3406571 RepID=UPI003BB67E87
MESLKVMRAARRRDLRPPSGPPVPAARTGAGVGFTPAGVELLGLLGEGRTVADAAGFLGIRQQEASALLRSVYARAFGVHMGTGYSSVRVQLPKLLDYAYSSGLLTPAPVPPTDLGDLPRRILQLVVDGVSSGDLPDRLKRSPADVAAGTRRLRIAAGLAPNEAWNKIVGWAYGSGHLTPPTGETVNTLPNLVSLELDPGATS